MADRPKVVIIGAGLAGCYLALLLAKKGYLVHIFEKRPKPHTMVGDEGKSFNITLYSRGIEALKKVGLWNTVKSYAQVAEGNVVHYKDTSSRYDAFDHSQEVLYTIHRASLNNALITAAKSNPSISLSFDAECRSIDRQKQILSVRNTRSRKNKDYHYDFLVGADGAYSAVTTVIQANREAKHQLTYSDWGYKEVHIPSQTAAHLNFRTKATHTWPRAHSLLLGFPNLDNSITLMLNLPLKGESSLETVKSRQQIELYLKKEFPDLMPLKETIITSIQKKPLGHFVTVKTSPWYYKDSIVLVGDAAHAVIPFYGQGMCAALDDCLTLVSLLSKQKNREKAFQAYQELRKRNTDVLAELSIANFIELRDRTRSERYVIKDQIYTLLNKVAPKRFQPPLYILIAHSSLPYTDAVAVFKKQDKIARLLGIDVLILFIIGVKKISTVMQNVVSRVKEHVVPIQTAEYYPIR